MNGPIQGQPLLRVLVFLARLVGLLLVTHAILFLIFDVLPAAEFKLGGWMVADPIALDRYRESLEIDDSGAWTRYARSLTHLIQGEFGRDLAGYSVLEILTARLQVSLPIVIFALLGIICGVLAASLWRCQMIPPKGWRAAELLMKAGLAPTLIVAVVLKAGALLAGADGVFADQSAAQTVSLAFLTGLLPASLLMLIASEEASQVVQMPFVTTMRSQGRSDFAIRLRLLVNIWQPLKAAIARSVLLLAAGLVFAEVVWDVPGFGRLFTEALQTADYTVLQGWMLMVATTAFSANAWEHGQK